MTTDSWTGMTRWMAGPALVGALVLLWGGVAAEAATPLDGAAVPSMCGHPAGRLIDGSLPGVPENFGGVAIKKGTIRTGVLKGRPGKVRAVVGWCSQGGVSWPEWLLVYTATSPPKRLAAVNIYNVTRGGRESIGGLRFTGGRLVVDVVAIGQKDDAACCGTADARLTFTWNGRLRLRSKVVFSERAAAQKIVDAVNSGDRPAALRYGRSEVITQLFRYRGTSRASLGTCSGSLSSEWWWDSSQDKHFTNASRVCLVSFRRRVGSTTELTHGAALGLRRVGFGRWRSEEALILRLSGESIKAP